ncbi:MAG: hypothetical protein R3342_13320 [Lutibacter sp.]|uniref:hypothetical protein n=1 Tax=Lutibacter sp. TaxID=1925666 RepID=UPI00299D35B3|nr:hypothetical protein [Lutibacter sp.]MDX1830514.1 hypothetical protein [Lutibacter sp.]
MKKNLILIGLIIGMNLTSSAQEVTLTKSELKSILCKQWGIEYAMINGVKTGQMPGASDFDFKFKKDGKFDLIRENGKNESGIWTYDTENKYVDLSIKGKITSRIKSIDKTKLIMTLVPGRNDLPGLPNVEVRFKPI